MLMVVPCLGIIAVAVAGLSAIQQSATREMNRQGATLASGVAESEFVFEIAPFASAHASTIVETREGLVTAWFAGTREGAADVGIWLARHVTGEWTRPIEVATGTQPDGSRYPCWNPVLFELPDKVLQETDPSKRDLLIKAAFEISNKDFAYIPLHQQALAWGVSKKLKVVQRADNQVLPYWFVKSE